MPVAVNNPRLNAGASAGLVKPSPEVCVKCKGRLWCGPRCFILERFEKKKVVAEKAGSGELQSHSPPGVFVSWHGHPKVSFSPMAPATEAGDAWLADDSDKWFGLDANKIISFRESLVRGSIKMNVGAAANPDYTLLGVQETLMAREPVAVEMQLDGAPRARGLSFSDFHAPMGPEAGLKKFSLTENPKVNPKIEKFFSDTDAKSIDAMVELFSADVGVNQLHKILSAGMLGTGKKRKLVPTRWSITAVDSNLSEYFVEEKIRHFPQLQEFQLFSANYLENYFFALLCPREWGYELLEAYRPGASWNLESVEPRFMADHEFYGSRKGYAENTAGGYYAVRIAVAEYLMREQKQATAIVFREIGDSGLPSLGVWKCRETVRAALREKPLVFSGLGLAMNYLGARLSIPVGHWLKNSALLRNLREQKRLVDFA